MTRVGTTGLEQAIDGFAATAFALCAAWSLFMAGVAPTGVVAAAACAGGVALLGLRRVGHSGPRVGFELKAVEWEEPVDDTLLLDDRLVEPEGDSQVVRLFAVGGGGRSAHVPGELAARIDHFLGGARPALHAVPAETDAAHELFEALAEIRRTLR